MRKVKAIQRRRWPLIYKGLRSFLGLANYDHHFIQESCDAQIGTRIMSKWIVTTPLFLMIMVGNMVDLVREWRSPLKGLPQTSMRIWGLDHQMHP
jgi:hypothetical protein